ncbi:MAG: FeoA family protein [Firmicutes bacterium]|jgi:ferrous iron transport protein A|nr:FeoA family protein [Bacillota bacterium]
MLPLSMAKAGEQVMVARIGGNPDVKKHLEDLGFVTGAGVKIVSAPGDGNVIVMVKDARLAITAEMAKKVMITL